MKGNWKLTVYPYCKFIYISCIGFSYGKKWYSIMIHMQRSSICKKKCIIQIFIFCSSTEGPYVTIPFECPYKAIVAQRSYVTHGPLVSMMKKDYCFIHTVLQIQIYINS